MNEPDPAGPAGASDTADPPSPAQAAQLRYLDVLPAEPITQAQAAELLAGLEAAPDWQPHLQAWNREKFQLHPDLFATPQRSFREGRWWQSQIADGSYYGYSFRQPSVQQALVILESLDRQTPGWENEGKKRRQHRFMNELATLSPELCKPGCSFPHELPADSDDSEEIAPPAPAFQPPSVPFLPTPYAALPAPDAPSRPAWEPPTQPPPPADATTTEPERARSGAWKWALLLLLLAAGAGAYGYFGIRAPAPVRDAAPASSIVSTDDQGSTHTKTVQVLPTLKALDSQRRAMEKYPDLARSGSPLNRTFVAMVHQLEVERSPRLQQPDWPEQVATECATALLIPPAGQKTLAPTPTSSLAKPAKHTSEVAPVPPKIAVATPAETPVPTLASSAAPSATPRAPGSIFVTFDAVNKASANNYTYHWVSYYGDYDISFRQSVGIDVRVRNMMREKIALTLRWAFFSRGIKRSNERNIFATAEKALDLEPGQSLSESLDSPMVQSRETVYYDYGTRYLSGTRYEGWLVQIVPAGSDQIIHQVGSTSYLEDYGKRSDFGALLKQAMGGRAGRGHRSIETALSLMWVSLTA